MDHRSAPLLCLATLAAVLSAAQEPRLVWAPEPGRYASARVDLVLQGGGSAEYRFLENGDGIWRPFSSALELTAFPREVRVYELRVRLSRGGESFEGEARYIIDRLPPEAPAVNPRPGSYEGPAELRLSTEPGAVIYYSLEALDRPSPGFRIYDPARPPSMDRPRDGTRSWTVSAYAVDAAGNPGPLVTARYVLEPNPTGPREETKTGAGDESVALGGELEYKLERKAPGTTLLVFPTPENSRAFAAVNPPDARNPLYYTEIPVVGGAASMELTAPAGWIGPLVVHYSRLESGRLAFAGRAVEVAFSFEDPGQRPPVPAEPGILYPPGTRTVLLSWEPSPFRIEVSVGAGPFSPYSAPISVAVPEGSEGLTVRYRSVGPSGALSAEQSLVLRPSILTSLPEISGLPEGGITNRGVQPSIPPGTYVRYEMSTEGFPPAVTAASPLLGENAKFPGEDGKEIRYTLRLRAFSDASAVASGSDERFISFLVDRSPPPKPKLSAGSLTGDTEEDRIIAFETGEGTLRYATLEKGTGELPAYRDYTGPLVLEGSGDRPLAYEVYAYAVDKAGNKSEILGPVAVRIDRASVYVASWGSDSGGGGARNPMATLSAGVAAALRSGRRFVRVQGDVSLGGPIRPAASLEILGGCDEAWEPVPGFRSAVTAPGLPGPWFIVQGQDFALRNLSISAEGMRDFTLAEATDAAVSISNLEIRIDARGELTVMRARESDIDWTDSRVELSGALFSRIIEAAGGSTRVSGLRVLAQESLGYFTGFAFSGGTAEISRLRAECLTSGGFTLVRGTGVQFDLRDSYLKSAGFGYCEAFRFVGGRAGFYLSSADLDCEGSLSFASLEDSRIDILNSTFVLRGGPVVFLNLLKFPPAPGQLGHRRQIPKRHTASNRRPGTQGFRGSQRPLRFPFLPQGFRLRRYRGCAESARGPARWAEFCGILYALRNCGIREPPPPSTRFGRPGRGLSP